MVMLSVWLAVCDRQEAWGRKGGRAGGGDVPHLYALVKHGQAVLKGLAQLHRRGVLHRGLTPDHILVRCLRHLLTPAHYVAAAAGKEPVCLGACLDAVAS